MNGWWLHMLCSMGMIIPHPKTWKTISNVLGFGWDRQPDAVRACYWIGLARSSFFSKILKGSYIHQVWGVSTVPSQDWADFGPWNPLETGDKILWLQISGSQTLMLSCDFLIMPRACPACPVSLRINWKMLQIGHLWLSLSWPHRWVQEHHWATNRSQDPSLESPMQMHQGGLKTTLPGGAWQGESLKKMPRLPDGLLSVHVSTILEVPLNILEPLSYVFRNCSK